MSRDQSIETASAERQSGISAGRFAIEGKNRDLLQKSVKPRHGVGASCANTAQDLGIGNDGRGHRATVASLQTTRRRAIGVGQDVDEYIRVDQKGGVSHV